MRGPGACSLLHPALGLVSSTALLLSDRYSCERPLTLDLGRIYDLCSVRLLLALLALLASLLLLTSALLLTPSWPCC
jgi:hypothetical protein